MRALAVTALAFAALAVLPQAGLAQQSIGNATTVENNVRGALPNGERQVGTGDDVFAREAIITAADSSTNLTFRDATTIAIGPLARVVLDRFVFNPDGSARRSLLVAARGALRWTSGQSDPKSYQIRTPLAAIGVRGTQFDLVVEDEQETVILRDGQVNVCLKGTKNCKPLLNPGDVAYITPAGISTVPRNAPSAQEFASSCLTGSEAACSIDPAGPNIVSIPSPPILAGLPLTGFRINLTTQTEFTDMRSSWSGSPSVQSSIGFGNVPGKQNDHMITQGFGITVGYDFRQGPVILGLEADASISPFNCEAIATDIKEFPFGGSTVRVNTTSAAQVNAQMSVRGKLGFALTDAISVYGLGGVMLANTTQTLSLTNNIAVTNQLYTGSKTEWRMGYVVGAGAEYMFTPNIGAMIEYSHYDLGTSTLRANESARGGATTSGQFATTKTRLSGDVIKTGITLRF